MVRQTQLPALVLHTRPYRESSALVQFFTRSEGRLSGVMRGLRRRGGGSQVQAFAQGLLSYSGRGELVTVTDFETLQQPSLQGDRLAAGFYVLEVLTRCLAPRQTEPEIYDLCTATLLALSAADVLALPLRRFELVLLNHLGYGIDFSFDAQSHAPIDAEAHYRYVADVGFVPGDADDVPGWMLQAIATDCFDDARVLRTLRGVTQEALAPLLGEQPLISRSMLQPGRSPKH